MAIKQCHTRVLINNYFTILVFHSNRLFKFFSCRCRVLFFFYLLNSVQHHVKVKDQRCGRGFIWFVVVVMP